MLEGQLIDPSNLYLWEQDMAEVGKAAPEFKLKSHDGSEVSLSQYQGSKWLVISAYPFAFTGG